MLIITHIRMLLVEEVQGRERSVVVEISDEVGAVESGLQST